MAPSPLCGTSGLREDVTEVGPVPVTDQPSTTPHARHAPEPLPDFADVDLHLLAQGRAHPVLADVAAVLLARSAGGEDTVAFYDDSPGIAW
ncbi:YxD-tail cyclophane-containing RiPP peptide [Streptomyces sp. cg35]|uniref:YxD-tail cyclophane-containing RiPP peptide n=1 Tax=Streptomyces sp. cg35 TaxID=3421650 RepID=UPI003D16EE7D